MSHLTSQIKNSVLVLSTLFLFTACGGGGSSDSSLPDRDTTIPSIITKIPDSLATQVDIIKPIVITFDEDIAAVNASNIALVRYDIANPDDFSQDISVIDGVRLNVTPQVVNATLILTTDNQFTNGARYKLTLLGHCCPVNFHSKAN